MPPSNVARFESAPILVYDDECGFCTYWTEYVARRSDLDVVGFSELTPELRELLPADYERSAHLITEDGAVYSDGESMEQAFLRTREDGPLPEVAEFIRSFDDYERLREGVYRWVEEHRGLLGRFASSEPPARVDRTG